MTKLRWWYSGSWSNGITQECWLQEKPGTEEVAHVYRKEDYWHMSYRGKLAIMYFSSRAAKLAARYQERWYQKEKSNVKS